MIDLVLLDSYHFKKYEYDIIIHVSFRIYLALSGLCDRGSPASRDKLFWYQSSCLIPTCPVRFSLNSLYLVNPLKISDMILTLASRKLSFRCESNTPNSML